MFNKTDMILLGFFSVVFAFIIFVLAPAVHASNVTCIGNNTLLIVTYNVINTTNNATGFSNSTTIDYSKEQYCPFGCENMSCRIGSLLNIQTLGLFFGVFILLSIVGYAWRLDPLVLIAGMIFIIIGVLLISQGFIYEGTLVKNFFTTGIGYTFVGISLYIIASVFI